MTAKKKPDPDKPKAKTKKGAKGHSAGKNDLGQTVSQHDIPLGRPRIEVTPEMLEAGRQYLLEGFEQQKEVVPTHAGLGCWLGISKTMVYELQARDADFMNLCSDIKTKQETMLVSGGLRGDHNPTICKLVLSKHGYSETLTHAGDPENPIQTRGAVAHQAIEQGKLPEWMKTYGITIIQD
jgi:hypothetical protein